MDSIWDEPSVPASASLFLDLDGDGHHLTRTNASEPLFLEDDDNAAPRRREGPEQVDVDVDDDMEDLFADFDAIAPPTEPLKVDVLMQKARARLDAEKRASNASSATKEQSNGLEKNGEGSKSADAKGKDGSEQKPRRVAAKVDDERLLGDRGFPALINEARRFKPKGKGHEAADLDRLMDLYQLWSHKMFPKTQFQDTVNRVERVCRQRRMQVNLSRWRSEAQHAAEDQGPPVDLDSDDEFNVPQQTSPGRGATVSASNNQPAREQPSTAPRVRVIDDANDVDIWAEIDNPQPTPVPAQEQSQANDEPDDFEDWFALNDAPVPSSASRKTPSVLNEDSLDFGGHVTDALADEEIDALFAGMDEAMGSTAPRPPLPTEDDFEAMYN